MSGLGHLDFTTSKVDFGFDSLEDAFPTVDCGHEPMAYFVIVQLRSTRDRTKGNIIVPETVKATDQDNTQIAKVIKVGPIAFHNRSSLAPWPGGPWYSVGDYVRCPKFGGDRWIIQVERKIAEKRSGNIITMPGGIESGEVRFVLLKDNDITAKVTGDPMSIRAYL